MVLDKGLIMFFDWHKTLCDSVFGYIDDFYVENNNLRISGWIIPTLEKESVNFYISIDNKLLSLFCYNERLDVAKVYDSKEYKFTNCGFDVSLPTVRLDQNKEVKIIAEFFNSKREIFSFHVDQHYQRLVRDSYIQEYEEIKIRENNHPNIVVVDNFYDDPDLVRRVALQQQYEPDLRYFKGKRTSEKFLPRGMKQIFENLLGKRIVTWDEHNFNGIFQYCTAQDPLVIHSDEQSYAGVVYLTPNAPPQSGTSFYRSKKFPDVRTTDVKDSNYYEIYEGDFYDRTRFDLVDTVGNVYNRLVIWNSKLIHSASEYFGNDKENSRLFHLFFFDTE